MSWLLAIGLKNAILALPLAAVALAASRWLRRPALAHLLWAIVLLKLITPPLIDVPIGWQLDVQSWLGSGSHVGEDPRAAAAERVAAHPRPGRSNHAAGKHRLRPRGSAARAGSTAPGPAHAAAAPIPNRKVASPAAPWFTSKASWPVIAAMVWGIGSLWFVGLFAWRAWRFCRYVRWATGRNEFLGPRVAELAHSVGIAIPPRVIVVDGIVSPMLWGLGQRACLIFPSQLIGRLSPANLDALLLHELAHYWRGDHWIRALELAAFVLFWWNPVVWWARREIEAAEEECCDAWVVEHQRGTRHSYAEALLATIDFLCERAEKLPPVACGLGEVQLLRLRLTQIIRGDVAAGVSRSLQVAVIAAGIIVSPLEPALWATSSPVRPLDRPLASVKPDLLRVSSSAVPPRNARNTRPSAAESSAALRNAPAAVAPPPPPIESLRPRQSLTHWGTAVSPDGKHRVEARSGGRIALAAVTDGFRVDLSAHDIRCVSFAPDSATFATGHPDALVRLWESDSGVLKASLQGSQAPITSIHISPDGTHVAAGAADGGVFVWEAAGGDVVAQLPPGDVPVSCLRWSPRGDSLAVTWGGFIDHQRSSLRIWKPLENILVREDRLDKPAGALDWVGDGPTLVIADWSGRAIVWDIAKGEVGGQGQVEKTLVSAAAWSPDCPLVARFVADPFPGSTQP